MCIFYFLHILHVCKNIACIFYFFHILVKVAISAGPLVCALIGHGSFLLIGSTIWDVKYSEQVCDPGEIIVTQSVLNYTQSNEWLIEAMTDGIHYKVMILLNRLKTLSNDYDLR